MVPVTEKVEGTFALVEHMVRSHGSSFSPNDTALIQRACSDIEKLYEGKPHWTGESMMEHTLGVLDMYLPFHPDAEGIAACLLHHTLDAGWTLDNIEDAYGRPMRQIVSGVHLLSYVTMKDRRVSLQNLRTMFTRVSDDIRVVLIILCNHYHILTRLNDLTEDDRRDVCRDTLHLFSPVASRLGIYSLKHRMEEYAFPFLYPTDALRIQEQLEQAHAKHGDFLSVAATKLTEFLKEAGIEARVEAREKAPVSIFQKMKHKSITHVEDIYDLFALRVIVADTGSCYQTLGVLHRLGHPVVNRFKDYIAFPKPNGYQSLHTTLGQLPGVPEGLFVEVQIRTPEMHRDADLGLAAHWTYKEGTVSAKLAHKAQLQKALKAGPVDDDDEPSHFVDHIFTVTPAGDIIELPYGATPLDFAFHVHTQLGLSYKGARVNGSIVPLTYHLENGDIVEILRHKEPKPSGNWVTVLKTASARAKLKKYLHMQDAPIEEEPEAPPVVQQQKHIPPGTNAVAKVDLNIPMPVKYARCCKPDTGKREALTGVISREGSVRVHRVSCKMLKSSNPGRRIGVKWEKTAR